MGEKGDEEQICVFLNAVPGRTITAGVTGDKSSILDVRVRTAAGELVNIEIQKAEKKMVYVTSDREALRAYQMRAWHCPAGPADSTMPGGSRLFPRVFRRQFPGFPFFGFFPVGQ
jgi:hypothetical protein